MHDRKTQSFRTEKVNFIFELIASSSGTPPEKKKGTSYLIDYLSLSAEREGLATLIPEGGGQSLHHRTWAAIAALSFCSPHLVRTSSSHLFQTKTPAVPGFCDEVLRKGRDSNPRYSCPYNGFRDRPIRPLWHLS